MVIACLYGFFVLVAAINLALMRRPGRGGGPAFSVLIPARDEEANLRRLVPELVRQGARVYVYDDESSDGTAEAALASGASVIRGGPLPVGWTGKNRACRELAKAASEDSSAEWMLFLDADVSPGPDFVAGIGSLIARRGRVCPVITGFPRFLPGSGLEPAYLSWMTWLLLCTNPFGLVARTGLGHSMFTNGQVTAWRTSTYWEINPHEEVKGDVLEDVKIGRLLARRKVAVEVADLGSLLGVRMYETAGQALNGMTKNSCQIAGPGVGSWLLALGLMLVGVGWAFAGEWWWAALGLLVLGRLISNGISRHPWWSCLLLPASLLAGVWTIVRSELWAKRGALEWKGRRYPG